MSNKGLVHIYCGDGKGKTTAAFGLASRCAGGGGKVLVFQFMKGNNASERKTLGLSENVTLLDGIDNMKFVWNMTDDEKEKIASIYDDKFNKIEKLSKDDYDMLILDEIISAVQCEFVKIDKLCEFIEKKPEKLEIVMTGRDPDKRLLEIADYISEIRKIKHPYDKNISARRLVEF